MLISSELQLTWGFRLALTSVLSICISPGVAGPLNVGGDVQVQVAPRSLKTLRDQNLVRQAQDYSCGAAALATLITFGLGEPVSEAELLADLFGALSGGDVGVRQREGFSLLDMQRVARQRGFMAQGFRISASDLSRLSGPVIVFIEPQGYKHFAVLRGVRGDRVFLADPSRGNISMPAYQFLDSWLDNEGNGIVFAVERAGGGSGVVGNALDVPPTVQSQPALMSARELLAVGAASPRFKSLHP